jgi:hypothetical protein
MFDLTNLILSINIIQGTYYVEVICRYVSGHLYHTVSDSFAPTMCYNANAPHISIPHNSPQTVYANTYIEGLPTIINLPTNQHCLT